MTPEISSIALNPRVFIPTIIVLTFFLPLLYSVVKTWFAANEK
jgi:hypothetical protein